LSGAFSQRVLNFPNIRFPQLRTLDPLEFDMIPDQKKYELVLRKRHAATIISEVVGAVGMKVLPFMGDHLISLNADL